MSSRPPCVLSSVMYLKLKGLFICIAQCKVSYQVRQS
jgi:hypothetical protein